MRWSIRYQLLIPLLTLLLGVVGMSIWAALASAGRARHQLETQVRDIVRTVNQSRYPLTENVLHQMKGFSRADYLLVRADGMSRSPWTTLDTADVELPPPATEGDDWQHLSLDLRVTVADKAYLCNGVRLHRRPNDGSILYIFYPESLWRDALWEAVWPSLVLGTFAGVAALVLTVALGRRLRRRIQELGRRTRQIAAGDFSPMPLPGGDDELRDLGRAVNEMAQRLAQYEETVRKTERLRLLGQVSGGLAHQLRNGVTGARLAVQLYTREAAGVAGGGWRVASSSPATRHPPPATPAVDTEALQVALRQLVLVEMHLKRFLDLGRSSSTPARPCSLSAVLDETVALLRPQCRHAHIDLRWQASGEVATILADATQLGHLFLNVLTNAIEAAGPGGRVEVCLTMTAEQAVVKVFDSGPGPSGEVAGRLFEPFVTGKPEGVGLGLAVARQVVEAHGGGIGWRREDGRTCFEIVLPSAPIGRVA